MVWVLDYLIVMSKNKYSSSLFSIGLLISLLFFVLADNVFASVDKVVFVSEIQNLDIGQISGPIKIQTEDQSGATTTASETIYLNLSTSGDGEFSSNKDTWKKIVTLSSNFSTSSIYISSGNSSRSFYYKGFTDGQHKITVSAKSKSGIVFDNIEQIINIGTLPLVICSSFTYSEWGTCSSNIQTRTVLTSIPSNCTEGSPVLLQSCTITSIPIPTTSSTTSTSNTITVIKTRIIYVSSHSGTEDLSDYEEKTLFEAKAGRERVTSVGSPIEFDAKYTLLQKDQCTPIFNWSFGDGLEAVGKKVTHTYKYPGEYLVVLNGSCGGYNSISRTIVRVITPNITFLGFLNGDVEIINNAKTEINIGFWKIKGLQRDFIFPQDTIIGANNKIILSKEDFNVGSSLERISLNNPLGRETAYFYVENAEQQNSVSSLNIVPDQKVAVIDNSYISMVDAEKLLNEYKEKLVLNEPKINKIENVKEIEVIKSTDENSPNEEDLTQTASVLSSVNSLPNSNFLSKLISTSIGGVKSFIHMFYSF